MNYNQMLNYFESLKNLGSKPGLERITELIEKMGNPHEKLKTIHVTGTNGKGSVCAMLESVLMEAGYKTGKFTSPWIENINEQIAFCGEVISDNDFAEVVTYIKSIADKMSDSPTEFEIITATAFEFFKRKNCDIVIVETGMGGLSDATNFIENPLLSIITCVATDHTNFLGKSIEEIATQKAGIIKDSVPVLYGGEDETAKKVIVKRAEDCRSEFYQTGKPNVISSNISGSEFEYRGLELKIPLSGSYQPRNAAIALDALDILYSLGVETTDDNIIAGLSKVKWKGRFEVLCKSPLFIFDGGHNIHGLAAVAESIKEYFADEKIIFLTGILADKDYEMMAKVITFFAKKVFTVTPDSPRALDGFKLAEVFGEKIAEHCNTIADGVKKALNLAAKENLPVVAVGSLYLYKDIIKEIKQRD